MTPPIPQIAGLNKELEIIEKEGGKQKRLEFYLKRSRKISKGVKDLGLSLFPKPGFESPTVTCVNVPEGMTGPEVYKEARARGFELAQGYGVLKERTFRIGNMGYIRMEDIDEMLTVLGEILKK